MPKSGGAGRRTVHINHRTTQGIYRGFDYAAHIGKPMNTFVVIRVRGDAGGRSATNVMRDIVDRFRNWLCRLNRQGRVACAPIYAVTIENPPGGIAHANWVIHVPEGHEATFEKKLMKLWATRALGAVGPGDVHIQPVDPAYAKRLAKYVTKGTNPVYAKHFYLDDLISDQGEVTGKRAGVSRAVGTRARKRAAFHPGSRAHLYSPRRGKGAPRGGATPPSPSPP